MHDTKSTYSLASRLRLVYKSKHLGGLPAHLPSSVMGEETFTVSVTDEAISLLYQKLKQTTFPDELRDAGWEYGVPLADLRRLVDRWTNGYDWRKHEAQLNAELPQFTRDIPVDGHGTLNIHYIHKRSEVEHAIPLLFVHGWPGSFIEARKIISLLTQHSQDHPSFHFVALSLPGYGYSQGPSQKKFGLDQYAEVCNELMLALGYNEYVTQGGDWGCVITRKIATLYGGKHRKAWHTNFVLGQPPSLFSQPLDFLALLLKPFTPREKAGLDRTQKYVSKGSGYMYEQATKPQTLGYSIADSPVGLLAWIYEKLVDWTDEYPWDDDEVLTWVSIFWFSRAGPAASLRIYFEIAGGNADTLLKDVLAAKGFPSIPLGLSRFPKEIVVLPKSWSKRMGKIVFEREHERGGHFAAHERPKELVQDLRDMFRKGGPAFGVVTGQSGYD
ncbi:putative epoxide hydrolase [Mycena venus]|uniref:Putative epoxide hydrolase n=1 Tax=Mycena venus TaxID=2733690 RepID=A0A8H6YSS3_9AGAR|nr:putative epoxide hydrolase [Mycena venus]